MINDADITRLDELLSAAKHVTVVQAENPDGDSLGSALALEALLSELDKSVTMFCAVDVPSYLRHLPGWDRVAQDKPAKTDLAIIVDASASSLLQKAEQLLDLDSAPVIVIDHHPQNESITAQLVINQPEAAATSQLIFEIASKLDWPINHQAAESMLASILADTLGLSLESVDAELLSSLAELHRVDPQLSIAAIENRRRELSRKEIEIITYKGQLLQRIEYFFDNQLAIVTIPLEEIKQYSHLYNPSVLVLEELRNAKQVRLAVALKVYEDKITGKLRETIDGPYCEEIAKAFGGGGHPGSAGFKVESTDLAGIKKQLVTEAGKHLL